MIEKNTNPALRRLRAGEKLSATWLQGANPLAAEIVAEAGFDIAMIDMEHGPGDILTLIAQIQAMKGEHAVPFVRAPWNDFVRIKRILDAGAYGILVPYVNTAEEAEAAVRATKYPPRGVRGIAGSPRASHYNQKPMEYLASAEDEICVLVAIETPTAVENLDAILAVDGLDGVFVGPMDLATSMGHFGRSEEPAVRQEITRIEEKALAAGKILASVAPDYAAAKAKYERGYHFVVFFSDTMSLAAFARAELDKFRASAGAGAD